MSTSPVAEALSLIDNDDPASNLFTRPGDRGYCPTSRVIANWHDEVHAGVFAFCDEQPCRAVRMTDGLCE